MSTLVKDRKASKMQYLATAEELHSHTIACTERLPKSATFLWCMPLVEASRAILASVSKASASFTDRQRRLLHVREALENLEYFEALLSSFMLSKHAPLLKTEHDFAYFKWGDLVRSERKLLRGLETSLSEPQKDAR